MLKDYLAETLYETIPHFHDTEARLAKLKEVVAADPMGRVKNVGPELDYLPWGARLITLECGIRFLTDYLEGDHYFRIHRPGQNLDRCRTQFKLVADMEACWDKMRSVVDRYR